MLANLFYQRTVQNLSFGVRRNIRCVLHTSRVSLFTQNSSKGHFLKPESTSLVFKQRSSRFWKKIDYYKLDKIPSGYQIIYQAPMRNYITGAQISTLVIAAGMIFSLYGIVNAIYRKTPFDNMYAESPLSLAVVVAACFSFVIAVQLVIRRFAMRIYYNEDNAKFIMMLPGILPKQERRLIFRAGEMKDLGESTLSGLKGQYVVNNNRFILYTRCFHIPYYLNVMLGHSRPFED